MALLTVKNNRRLQKQGFLIYVKRDSQVSSESLLVRMLLHITRHSLLTQRCTEIWCLPCKQKMVIASVECGGKQSYEVRPSSRMQGIWVPIPPE